MVPLSCGNERWIVQATKPVAMSAITTTAATRLKRLIPMARPTERLRRGSEPSASGMLAVEGFDIEDLSHGRGDAVSCTTGLSAALSGRTHRQAS